MSDRVKTPIIQHANYLSAVADARRAIAHHRPGRLIGICGLAGSGKTFIRNHVIREVVGSPDKWGTGKLAAVEVMALQDANGRFSPKGFAARAHRALMRPDLRGIYRDTDQSIQESYYRSLVNAEAAWKDQLPSRSTTEAAYWLAFKEAASTRELKYFLVEHAASLAASRKGEDPGDYMQNLMNVMEDVGAMGVLNVVPDGCRLWQGRPEIADRMDVIYIAPYDVRDTAEATHFAELVLAIAQRFPCDSTAVVRETLIDIGLSTGTSLRSIEELFGRAKVRATNAGRHAIEAADIRAALPTEVHVIDVWKQIATLKRAMTPANSVELQELHRKFEEMTR